MTKIAFIGGGSVQWAPKIVTDIALCEPLASAQLVLHDIDADALGLLTRACERIVAQADGSLQVTATLDRAETLQGADFVILCVAVGGLPAVRKDLEIPERYGIYQPVGDTVGPGGLARGLRHIPFAVQVAREMEQRCPDAWMLNVTNPMTTICRGVTRATRIRTIGLCHEVTGVSRRLAGLFGVPVETITLEVAGINHLPVILRFDVGGRNGMAMLRDWLAEHGPFAHVGRLDLNSVFDVFTDRLAVKLILFEQLGVLFGAGDRHVAEFIPGFLNGASERGRRYGLVMTTVDQRKEMARLRRAQVERFVGGQPEELQRSTEQLAPVMAALAGGPAGRFIVNIPNQGQIDNLPRDAVVECIAEVSSLGVRPLAVGSLPYAAYAVIAPHVARQELIVEAALTSQRGPALAALATDPLVHDPATAKQMLDQLLEANAVFKASQGGSLSAHDRGDGKSAEGSENNNLPISRT
jgi:alpha-galactosidase/6-phospho-beta-glucosidase family protein